MSGELAYRASIAVVDVTAGLVHSFGEQALKPAFFGLALSGTIHHPLIIAKLNKARREAQKCFKAH